MKKSVFGLFLGLLVVNAALGQFSPLQRDDQYSVFLNLRKVADDKLPVEIVPPLIAEDSVEFHMPRIIPGTYDIENYGQFVTEFKAFNGNEEELEVERIDTNRWKIHNASTLYRISYKADDSFDAEKATGIFEPAGTSVEDSVFLLNNFGFIGYMNGYKSYPYELSIAKPQGFYGSTSLRGEMGDTLDVFAAQDYFSVHDNPILYCIPDTAVKVVGGAEVMVSVYSPNQSVSANECMDRIAEVLDAAAEYLGGTLPVDKYTVLIYCVSLEEAGNSYGALEHHTSTVLYMPEFGGERFYSGVRDITSHEFFHIVTPLNIHSEHIADFDFIDPEMSKHIWFYEGVTEYNSHLVQIRDSIYELEDFLEIITDKLHSSDGFNQNIPLTKASEFTLTFFKDQYYNFYQKGAIAGMALDLKLRSLSDAEYGLTDLLRELRQTYGADTFFVDDQFFDIITDLTYPEMREFFALHFESAEPFPLQELLAEVGIVYLPEVEVERVSAGNIEYGYNFETGRIRVEDVSEMDEFGKNLGLQEGDELIKFNGQEIDLSNISNILQDYYKNTEPGDKVKVVIARPDKEGNYKTEELKARALMGNITHTHIIDVMEDPSEEQLKMRKAWINQ